MRLSIEPVVVFRRKNVSIYYNISDEYASINISVNFDRKRCIHKNIIYL